MHFLYLDDSGKIHPNDSAKVVVFAGFSVHESRWHPLARQISGAKANFFSRRANPHDWEIKSNDLLNPRAWRRANNRKFCFELARILKANRCFVYAATMEKARIVGPLDEAKFVPLAFQRLLAKFNDEVDCNNDTGVIVCDWSTHQMDRHIAHCVASMVGSKRLERMCGGVTYASSRALPCVQVCDLIAGTLRRSEQGEAHLDEFANKLRSLRYTNPARQDVLGYPIDSIISLC